MSKKKVEKIKTFYVQYFFSKIVPFMRKCGKNILYPNRPPMSVAHALFILNN